MLHHQPPTKKKRMYTCIYVSRVSDWESNSLQHFGAIKKKLFQGRQKRMTVRAWRREGTNAVCDEPRRGRGTNARQAPNLKRETRAGAWNQNPTPKTLGIPRERQYKKADRRATEQVTRRRRSTARLQFNAAGFNNHADRLASAAGNKGPTAAPGAHCAQAPTHRRRLQQPGGEIECPVRALPRGLQMGAFASLIRKAELGAVRGRSR